MSDEAKLVSPERTDEKKTKVSVRKPAMQLMENGVIVQKMNSTGQGHSQTMAYRSTHGATETKIRVERFVANNGSPVKK